MDKNRLDCEWVFDPDDYKDQVQEPARGCSRPKVRGGPEAWCPAVENIQMTIKELIDMGFRHVATWQRDKSGQAIYEGRLPEEPGLYLFVAKARVQYAGSTLVNLRQRMDKYKKRQANGDLSRPVHCELAAEVARGVPVEIYFRHISADERTPWDRPLVSVLLGAEAALIATLNPPWNRRRRVLLLDSTSVNDDNENLEGR